MRRRRHDRVGQHLPLGIGARQDERERQIFRRGVGEVERERRHVQRPRHARVVHAQRDRRDDVRDRRPGVRNRQPVAQRVARRHLRVAVRVGLQGRGQRRGAGTEALDRGIDRGRGAERHAQRHDQRRTFLGPLRPERQLVRGEQQAAGHAHEVGAPRLKERRHHADRRAVVHALGRTVNTHTKTGRYRQHQRRRCRGRGDRDQRFHRAARSAQHQVRPRLHLAELDRREIRKPGAPAQHVEARRPGRRRLRTEAERLERVRRRLLRRGGPAVQDRAEGHHQRAGGAEQTDGYMEVFMIAGASNMWLNGSVRQARSTAASARVSAQEGDRLGGHAIRLTRVTTAKNRVHGHLAARGNGLFKNDSRATGEKSATPKQ